HLYAAVRARGVNMGWIHDLVAGVAPLEAHPSGAPLVTRAVHGLTRSRLGALATRGLARFRRRLRVKSISDSFESSHLWRGDGVRQSSRRAGRRRRHAPAVARADRPHVPADDAAARRGGVL